MRSLAVLTFLLVITATAGAENFFEYTVAAVSLNLRAEPSPQAEMLVGQLPQGTVLRSNGKCATAPDGAFWCPVSYFGKEGWVNASYIFDTDGRIVASVLTANATNQQQVAEPNPDDVKCRSYGATPGTQEYFQCRMTLDQNRTQMQALRELQQQQIQERNKQRRLCIIQRGLCLLANYPPGACPVCQ